MEKVLNKLFLLKNHYFNIIFLPYLIFFKNYLLLLIFISLNTNFSKKDSFSSFLYLKAFNSEIHLIITGKGTQNIISDSFNIQPSDILVNGISKNIICSKTCLLEDDSTNITLIFKNKLTTSAQMFNGLTNLKEIDLSKCDFSEVTTMYAMFNGCINLEKINFGNIITSKVNNMNESFHHCKKIKSIDVSKFDTSAVITFRRMFGYCESLEYLDASNFNTSKVEDMFDMFGYCYNLLTINVSSFDTSHVKNMQGMFYKCHKLKYLDLSNFDVSSSITIANLCLECNSLVFVNIKSLKITTQVLFVFSFNIKYCVDDITTKNKIMGSNLDSNCSDICFKKNIKIDNETNICVEKCSDNKIEFNSICYTKCPNYLYQILINSSKTCSETIPKNFYYDSTNEIYKQCFNTCESCYGQGDDINNNCLKCKNGFSFINESLSNNSNCYKICDYYYYFDDNKRHFCTKNNSCPENYNKLIIKKNKCINKCKNDDLYKYEYNNICYDKCPNGTITNELIFMCYNETNKENDKIISNFQNQIMNGDIDNILNNITESREDYIQKDDDIIYQITTSENQQNNNKSNISTINLGDCETRLKGIYGINETIPLIIFKIDYFSSDTLIPIIAYEIYHPINKSKLDLKYCEDILIKLNIPVSIDEKNLFKYDPNSDYYTDTCYSYTTENGTDIILSDRKKEFSNNNLSLCENNCNYAGYSQESKQSHCDCNVKNKIDSISEIVNNNNKLSNVFINDGGSSSSNIILIKCSKTLFSKNGLLYNISSYILLFIITFFLISMLTFMKCGYYYLKLKIDNILKKKQNLKTQQKNKIKRNILTERTNNINRRKKTKKNLNKNNINNSKVINFKMINNVNLNQENNNISKSKINNRSLLSKKSNSKTNNNLISSRDNTTNKKVNKKNKNNNSKNKNNIEYNDFELNTISYKNAIIYDKRSFCQYYISLLKSKNLILFGFCPNKDNNSKIIKLCIFFLSFSIYYAMNFAFFNEKMIHKIFEDGGKYDFIYFLPKLSISFIISHVISIIIRLIFLSERNLMKIKMETSLESAERIADKEKRNLVLKYVLFFIISIIFLGFFWFLLSSFGAVYKNTQIYVFENTLISFAMSFLYEIIISIIPCIFRISSLNNKNKDNECIYNTSKFLQLL